VEVTRSAAIDMFLDLGFKTCRVWEDPRIERKLNKLPEILKDTPDLPTKISNDENHLCHAVCRAVTNLEKINLIPDEGEVNMAKAKKTEKKFKRGQILSIAEYEGRSEDKSDKKTVKASDKKLVKNKSEKKAKNTDEKKEKKEKAGVNKFGYRIGTKSDTIDNALSKKPLTLKELADKTGLDVALIRMHLMHAIAENRGVKKTDDGFSSTI